MALLKFKLAARNQTNWAPEGNKNLNMWSNYFVGMYKSSKFFLISYMMNTSIIIFSEKQHIPLMMTAFSQSRIKSSAQQAVRVLSNRNKSRYSQNWRVECVCVCVCVRESEKGAQSKQVASLIVLGKPYNLHRYNLCMASASFSYLKKLHQTIRCFITETNISDLQNQKSGHSRGQYIFLKRW